jgi:hypothetical protein
MDNIVFDLSSQTEADANIFIKKDYVSILDNQNGIYSSNQSVIDTSQFSNSNKYINYREGYFTIPMLLTLTQSTNTVNFLPLTVASSCDYALGLKNWYGSIIHSFSVDLAGTTIIQQTPFQSLWNTFKLMTSLSYQDLLTIGPSIGFYPDNSSSWYYSNTNSSTTDQSGKGVCNNLNAISNPVVSGALNALETTNNGFYQRQRAWNFNVLGLTGVGGVAFSNMITQSNLQMVYKSTILPPVDGTTLVRGYWAAQIVGQVYLRHLHEFFNKIPLVKGMFMKMTMNLNNSSTQFTITEAAGNNAANMIQSVANSSFPNGGINPIMVASGVAGNGAARAVAVNSAVVIFFASLVVGSIAYETNAVTASVPRGYVNNLTLTAPCYTFNPAFEGAYLSNAIRKIDYEDIYQYQVLNVTQGQNFNNLITNGIAGIKSVLVLPFHSASAQATTSQFNNLISPLQSCFDTAGGGTTSPLTYLNNFNVVISGQNAIYNTQRYTYEAFLNQLNGQNSVNGNQIDGMGSGLVSQMDFENCYNYYYVNTERCLPIEKGVSKSVSIVGQNVSLWAVDLYVFICYSISVNLNILLGSRV